MEGPGFLRYAVSTKKSTWKPSPYAVYHKCLAHRYLACASDADAPARAVMLFGPGSAGISFAGECWLDRLPACGLRSSCGTATVMRQSVWPAEVWDCGLALCQADLARAADAQPGAGGLVVEQWTEGYTVDHSLALGDVGLAGGWDAVAGTGTTAGMATDAAGRAVG